MSHFHDQSRGNYRNYYLRRRANHTDLAPDRDERLDLLTKNEHGDQLFKNKIVLDVGCNSGAVSTEIAQLHQPRRVVGVDIDVDLIQSCNSTVQQAYSIQKPTHDKAEVATNGEKRKKRRKLTRGQEEEDPPRKPEPQYFPACFPALYDIIPINPKAESSSSSSTAGPSTTNGPDRKRRETSPSLGNIPSFPQNLVFYAANWAEEEIETDPAQYDVILALSLTKWIHLHGLDEGLMRFFRKCFDRLAPDGKLVLEKQGWRGYKDAKRSSQTLKDNYFKLKLRPEEDFERILLEEIGFKRREAVKDGSSSGFDRSLEVYYKRDDREQALHRAYCHATGR